MGRCGIKKRQRTGAFRRVAQSPRDFDEMLSRLREKTSAIPLDQVSGLPIFPVSSEVKAKWCLKSWDAFQVPLPFARCKIRIGRPMVVPRHATEEDREQLRQSLEREMMRLTSD